MNRDEFPDDPEDTAHSVEQRENAASRSTWVSVGVNLLFTITQVTASFLSRSQGLVADGIHSLSDLVAEQEVEAIRRSLAEPGGVRSVHDVRTRPDLDHAPPALQTGP